MLRKPNRALFIYLQPWLSITPMLRSLVNMMGASGWKVTIITIESENATIDAPYHPNVDIYSVKGSYGKSAFDMLHSLINCMMCLAKIFLKQRYDLIFGVEPNSLFLASTLGIILRKPTIYISLELYFLDELSLRLWRIYKQMEQWCSRRCYLVLSQDPWRCRLLAQENGLNEGMMISLPNTDLGPTCLKDSTFLHSKLGISEDKTIILYPGGNIPQQVVTCLEKVVKDWPEEWRIVFHTGYFLANQKHNMIPGDDHIVFSGIPFPYDQLEYLYSSANIGFVWYYNRQRPGGGKNQDFIGYSSGKFNLFVKYGKPVITSNQITFKEIFQEYRCGIAIDSLDEINGAIRTILANIDTYRSEAIRLYEERLRFERYFNAFQEKIQSEIK